MRFGPLQAGLPGGGGVQVPECGRSEAELWVGAAGGTGEGAEVGRSRAALDSVPFVSTELSLPSLPWCGFTGKNTLFFFF